MRQIAGPNARLALANSQIDRNLDLATSHRLCRGSLVVPRRAFAFFRHELIAERNLQPVAIGRVALIATGANDQSGSQRSDVNASSWITGQW